MSKEIMKKGAGSIALFGDDLDSGFENVTQEDTTLPYVRILGQLSAEVNEGEGKYISGAKPGMIYNNITNEIFDGKKGIKVVPCYYKRDFPEKSDKGDGMAITVVTHSVGSPIIETGKREGSKIRLPNGNYLEETAYYYVLMETKSGGMTPALITMKSSQLSVSKKWIAMMKLMQVEDGKGGHKRPPMHGVVYNLSSALQKNDKGSWYGWSVTQDRIMGQEDIDLYKIAKELKVVVGKGKVQTKGDVEEKAKDSTPY
jgi:hypothetical protein